MPGFHVDNFKSNIKSYARGYLFNVTFSAVPGTCSYLKEDDAVYLVRSSSTPESTIDPIEVPWQGQTYKIGSTHTFAEWSCTFNVDGQAEILKTFYEWTKLVHEPSSNIQGKPNEYLDSEARIELLDVKSNPIITYVLHQLWPSSVAGVEIAQDSKEVSQVEVTFQYNWHTIE